MVRELAEKESEDGVFKMLSIDVTRFLTTILIGTTVVNIGTTALVTKAATTIFGEAGVAVLLLLTEITPKSIAVHNATEVARFVYLYRKREENIAAFDDLFSSLCEPYVTEDELKLMLRGAELSGTIEEEEQDMIENVLEIKDTHVREVMTPLVDVVAIDASATLVDFHNLWVTHQYSRVPVFEQRVDNIVGIAYAMDLLDSVQKSFVVGHMAHKPAYFVPDSMSVWNLLREFRIRKVQMAVVLNEYDGTVGMVTLEDVFEEIVGEIFDENDSKEEIQKKTGYIVMRADGIYDVDANTSIDQLSEDLNIKMPEILAGNCRKVSAVRFERVNYDDVTLELLCFTTLETLISVVNIGATAPVTNAATTIFGEAAVHNATEVARFVVRPVAWLSLILYPVGRVVGMLKMLGLKGRRYYGFALWLHFVLGIQFQIDNEPFKVEMKQFTAKVVDMMKQENSMHPKADPLSYSRDFPGILIVVELEIDPSRPDLFFQKESTTISPPFTPLPWPPLSSLSHPPHTTTTTVFTIFVPFSDDDDMRYEGFKSARFTVDLRYNHFVILIAPRLARRGGVDEPFAWENTEYLRKLCMGKDVTFKVDYTVPSIGQEFGSVFLGDKNVALMVVSDGWIREQGQQKGDASPFLAELLCLEEQAKQQGLGRWTRERGTDCLLKSYWPKLSQVLGVFKEQGLVLAALLGLSAFFSMAETSITTLWPWKVRELAEKESEDGIFKMLSIDVTRVVNIGATAPVTNAATTIFGEAGVSAATGVMTVAVLLLTEITPKSIAVHNATEVSRFVFQIDNEPFKVEMKQFTAKVVDMMKQENSMHPKADPLSYSRDFPGILIVVELEIDPSRPDLFFQKELIDLWDW
ncbi:putative DUF21 domain-containing protein [Camellia lanceoleosa]|uniref:DUF21 domain-containing protein n=1 Tax=Camellia lanceoleosa TaxID=1840588 RepID=A0ACC0GS79_9ERIC|nr:putative DUF21 domain-containing protein [Camellia lanceoleosa]